MTNWQDTECVISSGSLSDGYGRLCFGGKTHRAHRVVYERTFGPIPPGLVLDHLCRNRACINPFHLEAVTQRENLLRGETLNAANKAKIHCPKGHEFTPENTYQYKGKRGCRACRKASANKYKALQQYNRTEGEDRES